MGGFSNFAISFSIISILIGAVTLYGHGVRMSGPFEMAVGWPLVTLFTLTVAMSMAELASALPTSGSVYHWSSRLDGSSWGWFTAWFNIAANITMVAGVDYGCALFVTPLIGLEATTRNLRCPADLALRVVGGEMVFARDLCIRAGWRDDGLPASRLWRRVSQRHQTPGPAIWS